MQIEIVVQYFATEEEQQAWDILLILSYSNYCALMTHAKQQKKAPLLSMRLANLVFGDFQIVCLRLVL